MWDKILRLLPALHKTTPILVHILMMVSVSLYAVFGALVMRQLESKQVIGSGEMTKAITHETNIAISNADNKIAHFNGTEIPPKSVRRLRHAKRRRLLLDEQLAFRHEPESEATIMQNHKCILSAIKEVMKRGKCLSDSLTNVAVSKVDHCYRTHFKSTAKLNRLRSRRSTDDPGGDAASLDQTLERLEPWSFVDAVLFCITIITTIGYGNVAPQTFGGRLFCILYGLVGIPLTLLAIADLGKFLSEMMEKWHKIITAITRKYWSRPYLRRNLLNAQKYGIKVRANGTLRKKNASEEAASLESGIEVENSKEQELHADGDSSSNAGFRNSNQQTISLMIFFLIYILFGALMVTSYEPDMDYFKAIYFNFVTLTTIGLGDIVPKSETFMLFTIIYIIVGLAITTIAIEIAADALKKLHYFGRKIENVAHVPVWFGSKKLTMRQIIRNFGDQFNLPAAKVQALDLDHFVDQAIKVEAGEIPSLRPAALSENNFLLETAVNFADDDPWTTRRLSPALSRSSTPRSNFIHKISSALEVSSQPSPEPPPVPKPELEPEPEPEPEPESEPEPEPQSPHDLEPAEPQIQQEHEPSPEPHSVVIECELFPLPTPSPEPSSPELPPSPSPEQIAEPECTPTHLDLLEYESDLEESVLIIERPPPEENTMEPEPQPQPEPEQEPEPEPKPPTPAEAEPLIETVTTPETPKASTPPPIVSPTPRHSIATSILPMDTPKKSQRDYSNDAWRRYQEYQKQWSRFRETKAAQSASSEHERRRKSQPHTDTNVDSASTSQSKVPPRRPPPKRGAYRGQSRGRAKKT